MKRKTILAITIFFIIQALVTGACCKLSAEKYTFRDHNCKITTIDINDGKLLDSQKNCDDDWFIGKDPAEEIILKLFQEQKSRYSHGSRVDSVEDTVYFYEYDRKTGTLTTYAKVCKPEPYNYSNPELARISKKLSEITKNEETVKKYIINNVLNSPNKEDK